MNWLLKKPAGRHRGKFHPTSIGRMADDVGGAATASDYLRLEVSVETLSRLLASGQLCAADFRCLDCESKQCVWRLLLMNCDWSSGTNNG